MALMGTLGTLRDALTRSAAASQLLAHAPAAICSSSLVAWEKHRRAPGKDFDRSFSSQTVSTSQHLAYHAIDAGEEYAMAGESRSAVLVHGLLGSGRNWRTFSKRLAAELSAKGETPWTIYLVDLRNHGKTYGRPGFDGPHTMTSAAEDLMRFAAEVVRPEQGRAPDAVIGHSLGGKIVLEYVKQMAEHHGDLELPSQAWVLDSVPGEVPEDNSGVPEVLETVKGVPTPIPSKGWLDEFLEKEGYSKDLRLWLATSLIQHPSEESALAWQFDVHGAASMYLSYRNNEYWDLLERPPLGTEIHLVRAADSDRWAPDVMQSVDDAVEISKSSVDSGVLHHLELPNAGHWLHVDNPTGLHDMMLENLARIGQ